MLPDAQVDEGIQIFDFRKKQIPTGGLDQI
jgi:hypothetical protein